MASFETCFSLALLALVCSISTYNAIEEVCTSSYPYSCNNTLTFNQKDFGDGFLFGAATAAYQVEGTEGRAFNVWDTYTHRWPNFTTDKTNGDVTSNSFDFYLEDVQTLKQMGLGAYRLSIAWSRILPRGTLRGGVDPRGIAYYKNLFGNLTANGIKPFVTLFHWDLPQPLQDAYGGFLSPRIVNDFKDYANLCFQEFGDQVKNWITLNQPFTVANKGYADGSNAPGRCTTCPAGGNSGIEPYLVAHHQLLAHAVSVDLYRKTYKPKQKGIIGTTLISRRFLPWNESEANKNAAERGWEFMFGWFMEPMTSGDYPTIMRKLVGNRLPYFSAKQKSLLKGSLDFLGLNYYFTQYVIDKSFPPPDPKNPNFQTDQRIELTYFAPNGSVIGPPGIGFYYYPPGFREVLQLIKEKYNNPLIYITENGFDTNGTFTTLDENLQDYGRVTYHCAHLCTLKDAIENGSNVKGYFVWSLIDNFEFGKGFTVRFGMNYIDFNNPYKTRVPKVSAIWFKEFVNKDLSPQVLSTTSTSDDMVFTI